MLKNLTPRLRLCTLLMTASFVVLLLSGCAKHNDDNSGCVFSNSLLLQSHLSAGAAAEASEEETAGLKAGTNGGANNGSNPTIALSIPGVGEIPGTEDLPLDVGEVLTGFGGEQYIAALEALQRGDIQALLDALDARDYPGPDSVVDVVKAVQSGDLQALLDAFGR